MIQTKTVGARLNATMCPHNPDLVAFVNNGDLWLVNLETRQVVSSIRYMVVKNSLWL